MKNKTVAIEIKKGSETFTLFSQIYPTFFCPCLVFIQNGLLVFFLNAEATKEKIIESINKYSDMEQANNTTPIPNQTANASNNNVNNINANPTTTPPQAVSPVSAKAAAEKAQKEKELNDVNIYIYFC
ncbi:hypothetical protein PIROE2DRAFT_57590 [Piromyces sp. E2]|nr:hypothetical protein PIROE2DRAFT_57590 [Piromyces sp. E2]|eukprot:OUM69230.1 hypothetical protein PIROE2DRAFT_57590 [Piromyces sp. E2]